MPDGGPLPEGDLRKFRCHPVHVDLVAHNHLRRLVADRSAPILEVRDNRSPHYARPAAFFCCVGPRCRVKRRLQRGERKSSAPANVVETTSPSSSWDRFFCAHRSSVQSRPAASVWSPCSSCTIGTNRARPPARPGGTRPRLRSLPPGASVSALLRSRPLRPRPRPALCTAVPRAWTPPRPAGSCSAGRPTRRHWR